VDISENNLVELVRDIRSSIGYISGDFNTFAIDCGSYIFDQFMQSNGPYDYILNLSALKHVRSESNPYTLMRLIEVNILNTYNIVNRLNPNSLKKYFAVSTDKAANPVNLMGASKLAMEKMLMNLSCSFTISTSRFANVAFSDGSLLDGFRKRVALNQPISAPIDIQRYFMTSKEAGELCVLSTVLGKNGDIFFPKLKEDENLISFAKVAVNYLNALGYEVVECDSEHEARSSAKKLIPEGKWPCYFFESDTTGEKNQEEFFTDSEEIDLNSYIDIGIIKNLPLKKNDDILLFINTIGAIAKSNDWQLADITNAFNTFLPELRHLDAGKYLNQRM